ncbi:MAG: PadR family transcriptional regulator [Lachnospiraceae bacterium]|nr:PadR family transcriptional regulator [Lachnospiraceae bacterium]
MRTLKYAILGLLMERPMAGYDIMKAFSEKLNEFWYAKHSQIYPELKRLEEEGLVSCQVRLTGEVMEKKFYTITPAGIADFRQWLDCETPLEPTPKDVFRLKTFFSQFLSRESQIGLTQSQIRLHEERLSHLLEEFGKFPSVPAPNDSRLGDYMILEHGVMREQMTIQWLNHCLDYLNR